MKEIKITVADKIASTVGAPVIVCGNSNYKITFTFDSEWGAYQEKTARFTFRKDGIDKYIDVLFSGNSCTVPVLTNIERVNIGVYAGDLRTTTGAEIRCKKSILCKSGLKHEQPPEDVYNEILEIVGKKLNTTGGTVTGDYTYNGNTFIHEGNLDLLDNAENVSITKTVTGSALTIDSANAPFNNLKLFGKTTQDGTPTPDAPKELKSVGDSGSFNVGVYGKNLFPQSNVSGTTSISIYANIPKGTYTFSAEHTSNDTDANFGLLMFVYTDGSVSYATCYRNRRYSCVITLKKDLKYITFFASDGITKSEGDTFTYSNIQIELGTTATDYEPYKAKQTLTMPYISRGVGEVADEVDFARGVLIQRFDKVVFNGSEDWKEQAIPNLPNCIGVYVYKSYLPNAKTQLTYINGYMCDSFKTAFSGTMGTEPNTCSWNAIGSNFLINAEKEICGETLDGFKTWLASNPVTVIYELETPIETPLSETELNAYRSLMTNKGTTTVLNSEGADTEITYYVNKPNAQAIGNIHTQINKDYLKLQQAIIETGGN